MNGFVGRPRPASPSRSRSAPRAGAALGCAGLGALALLAGCAAGPSGAPGPGGPGGAARQAAPAARDGLAAVRAGLSGPARRATFYLALGDSLSIGIQPGPAGRSVPTAQGYPDLLAARLRRRLPGLRLVKLGCSGETTATMIHGGTCGYPAGSQLAQATRFLRARRGRVALVTIDIGANDPNACVLHARPAAMIGCLYDQVPRTERNLRRILAALRAAAGPRVLIVGMTYYVPELALWRDGPAGRQIALVTDGFAAVVNHLLAIRYRRFGARVANVFAAFGSTDFGPALRGARLRAAVTGRYAGPAPPSVARICALTWMCPAPPGLPNEHPNAAGYRVIARTFWQAITG